MTINKPISRFDQFINNSKLTLSLRNMFLNRENQEKNKYSGNTQELGQLVLLDFKSGYLGTENIGFGVDVLARSVVKLSSDGHVGAQNQKRTPGHVIPVKSNGKAVNKYTAVDFIGKGKISESEIKAGRGFRSKLPILISNDGRLLPQVYTGYLLTSRDVNDAEITVGNFKRVKGRVSMGWHKISIAGAGLGVGSSNLYFAGADYKPKDNIKTQYYFANLEDFYYQHFFGINHDLKTKYGKFTTDLRFFYSGSQGKNARDDRLLTGYTSRGYYGEGVTKGEIDNKLASLKLGYDVKGHLVELGYQHTSGKSDLPHVNESSAYAGDFGNTAYVITQMFNNNFVRAGEKTFVGRYKYDFKGVGINGLSTGLGYASGRGVKTANANKSQWERNLFVEYEFKENFLKGLRLTYRNSILRGNVQDDMNEHYFIANYSIDLF